MYHTKRIAYFQITHISTSIILYLPALVHYHALIVVIVKSNVQVFFMQVVLFHDSFFSKIINKKSK